MTYWLALLAAIAANITANVAFKILVRDLGDRDLRGSIVGGLLHPALWTGLVLGGLLVLCFLYALRAIPLTVAYTSITCVSIAGVALSGALLFGETVNAQALGGIAVAMIGVILLVTA
jgi:undecaprenyl phosphate-alpha-L-ara4N flippase subunit ArnE